MNLDILQCDLLFACIYIVARGLERALHSSSTHHAPSIFSVLTHCENVAGNLHFFRGFAATYLYSYCVTSLALSLYRSHRSMLNRVTLFVFTQEILQLGWLQGPLSLFSLLRYWSPFTRGVSVLENLIRKRIIVNLLYLSSLHLLGELLSISLCIILWNIFKIMFLHLKNI